MAHRRSFFAELKRRNVWRAAALYVGAAWALSQGLAQLGPFFGAPAWSVRWFVIACCVGFPFWIAFAWYYAWTPQGFKLESKLPADDATPRISARRLDFWIIGVLAAAVVLLATNTFVLHRDATSQASASSTRAALATLAKVPVKSVAVLPFRNESGNAGQRYFSDGLSEDLITALSQLAGLKVSSSHASFQFRDSSDSNAVIAAKLGVAHLVEGSVQRAGDDVRISVELVNAADGSTAWSQHYDRPFKDLFKLQDDVTRDVSAALKAKLVTPQGAVTQSDRPPSGNLDAYLAFLHGRAYFRQAKKEDLYQAVKANEAAIQLDPHYAAAYAALSDAWSVLGEEFLAGAEMKQAYAKSMQAANTAIALDPELAEGHRARALVLQRSQLDFKDAKLELDRAKQLDPAAFKAEATGGNPQNAGYWFRRGERLDKAGHLEDAEKALQTGIAMRPEWWVGYMELELIQVRRGEAKAAMDSARHIPAGVWRDFAAALAAQIGDDRALADASLKKLIGYENGVAAYQIAKVYAVRKDPDNVFKWLDQAWTIRDPGLMHLASDPYFAPYREDTRFVALVDKLGLPAPGTSAPATASASVSK